MGKDQVCAWGYSPYKYPMVAVKIKDKGKTHNVKAAVSSCLAHPLILGMDWLGFHKLVGQCAGVRS